MAIAQQSKTTSVINIETNTSPKDDGRSVPSNSKTEKKSWLNDSKDDS